MNDTNLPTQDRPALPDQLSVNGNSPFYNEQVLQYTIGVLFNQKERTDVLEYCISEGWIKVAAGKAVDRKGYPLMMKLKGEVQVFYK